MINKIEILLNKIRMLYIKHFVFILFLLILIGLSVNIVAYYDFNKTLSELMALIVGSYIGLGFIINDIGLKNFGLLIYGSIIVLLGVIFVLIELKSTGLIELEILLITALLTLCIMIGSCGLLILKIDINNYFMAIPFILMGFGGVGIFSLEIIHRLSQLFKSWGIKDPISGVTVIVTIITFTIGLIVRTVISERERKQSVKNELHKEIKWREQLHNLEMKERYTISDLVKLNTFFNPYHEDNNQHHNIDVELNELIVRILSKYTNRINDNCKTTLFDFNLTDNVMDIVLTVKETQDIRKYIHNLLKNDWDMQTKY